MKDQSPPAESKTETKSESETDSTQRRDEGAPLGILSWRPGRLVIAVIAAVAVVAAVSTALVFGGDSGTATVAKSSKPPTVEKLASALKCKADIQKKVEDYRLGVCTAKKTKYTFVTFKDNRAKRGWLDFSKDYGGTYLVGSRWIVVTDAPSKLGPIQGKWGGTVERGKNHGQGHGRN
ncbi:hypothetical protein [Streptomyces abyssalis]|uniref:hypothetical protein n=1 Tax=Streptomyces abyssalis TaxID=933944 RepID=UPI00085C6DCC|nr:hypothetical protein [Streptomyces abyssalis]